MKKCHPRTDLIFISGWSSLAPVINLSVCSTARTLSSGFVLAWIWLAGFPVADMVIVIGIPALCVGHLAFVTRRERMTVPVIDSH